MSSKFKVRDNEKNYCLPAPIYAGGADGLDIEKIMLARDYENRKDSARFTKARE